MFTTIPTEARLTEADHLTVAGHQTGGGGVGEAVVVEALARGPDTVRVLRTGTVFFRLITGQFHVGKVVHDWGGGGGKCCRCFRCRRKCHRVAVCSNFCGSSWTHRGHLTGVGELFRAIGDHIVHHTVVC